ncbi:MULTISPECIES: hypothetical protein [Micromonospora]|uniref:hypothetical protein n=1 Tax=Micromonospora TaxID=1873 RepID=UPI00140B988F|nr:hypothetical protein [Micromonospora sp. CMU55-4]NHO80439.1 hypothetical protein [Micromonospora sp. CMU55-4]
MTYPLDWAITSLRYAGPHLAVTAPVLYQDYDRLKAEAELRLAIVPPLFFMSVLAPLNGKLWVVSAVALACIVLLGQAVAQTRAANNVLANAAYIEQVTIPAVKAVADYLAALHPKPNSDGAWIGAMLVAMHHRALFDEAGWLEEELLELSGTMLFDAITCIRELDQDVYHLMLSRLSRDGSGRLQAIHDSLAKLDLPEPSDL